jgi:hypothetical protein
MTARLVDLISQQGQAMVADSQTRMLMAGSPAMEAPAAPAVAPTSSRSRRTASGRAAMASPVAELSLGPGAGSTPGSLASGSVASDPQIVASALRIDPTILIEHARAGGLLTAGTMIDIHQASLLKHIDQNITLAANPTVGRVVLDADHEIDWDYTPTIYQATTVAHGHLLTFKQTWRADGYSLGDLLYSLPLAPGQKKEIALIDWQRQETTTRQAARTETERLAASMAHDRDIGEILNSALRETTRGHSESDIEAVAAGIGGFIGPVIFGVAGGYSNSSSSAWQNSSRDVSGSMLSQMRDRTTQAATAIRSQRSTVMQTARQGESLSVQTEVVANHNHCHAMTVEYFEVLRHFQVDQEIVQVQECLFVPFEVSEFTAVKALRWREPLAAALRRRELLAGFGALYRASNNWADADWPAARFADDVVRFIEGEVWITVGLPRPTDNASDGYDDSQWAPYSAFLPSPPHQIWQNYLGDVLPADRNRVWNSRIAPMILDRIVRDLTVDLVLDGGTSTSSVPVESTLISRFGQNQRLLVSIRPTGNMPSVTRARIFGVNFSLPASVPASTSIILNSGTMRYRTDHIAHALFQDYGIDNDLASGDSVEVITPLDSDERRNPIKEDRRLCEILVQHLNDHLEYYHQAIWLSMDPNHRYLLLDGFIAPNAGGRSISSVVENRLIGIAGNCLIMPVVPGVRLDPGYKIDPEHPVDLIHAYATEPPPPARISVPTQGVFAEAVMGQCNSCEVKDDTRFWRWEESPNPDEPTAIRTVSTDTRRTTPPDLSPDAFPTPLVALQNTPRAPEPTGLAAALALIGSPNLFRDITGLDLTQKNALQAFQGALNTAKFFGDQAAGLAQQRFMSGETDRNLKLIGDAHSKDLITSDQAQSLTQAAISGSLGQPTTGQVRPTSVPAVQKAIERASSSNTGRVVVTRPGGSVDITTGNSGQLDFKVDPGVEPVSQPSDNTCWAAAGAMLLSWKRRQSMTIQEAADQAGTGWREKLDGNIALHANELQAYAQALGIKAEALQSYLPRGILQLLQQYGPLWVIGDDAVPDDHMSHVRIVTGIHGDGSPTGTTVTVIDPANGQSNDLTYLDFATSMEADDPTALGLGVYHF